MIRVTNTHVSAFLKASEDMAAVELENDRGNVAAELHSECTIKQLGYQFRMKALEKERARIIKDNAQKDAKGDVKLGEAPDGNVANRPVIWRNAKAGEAAVQVWLEKVEALNKEEVTIDLPAVKDDFFAKPHEVLAKHGVRIAFLPFQQKHQGALKASTPKKRK